LSRFSFSALNARSTFSTIIASVGRFSDIKSRTWWLIKERSTGDKRLPRFPRAETLAGIAVTHMIRKQQLGESGVSAFQQLAGLAA
jgi:hypothetical protein